MLKNLASPAWAILEHSSHPLLLLIATPWFLHQLGTEQYGHWMLLTATAGFGAVLNGGTGSATIKAISGGAGRNLGGYLDHAVNSSLAIAILGGGVLAVLAFLLFWMGAPVILSRMGDPELIRLTGTAAAAIIWIEQLDNVFSSAMKGAENFGAAARVEVASKATQIGAAALIVYYYPTLPALYSALLIVAILRLAAKIVVAKRLLGLAPLRPSFSNASEILKFARWGWLQGVGSVLFSVADRMLIGSMLGAASLTYYSIATQLAMQVHAVSAAGLSVIFPKVSRKLESGGTFSLRRVTKITMAGNLLLSTSLAVVLIYFGPAFLRLWIGTESAIPTSKLLPWLVVVYWVLALNAVFYYLLLGMGKIRYISLTVTISGAAAAIAVYFALSSFGLIGAPVGRAVYAVLTLTLIFPVLKHLSREGKGISRVSNIITPQDGGQIP